MKFIFYILLFAIIFFIFFKKVSCKRYYAFMSSMLFGRVSTQLDLSKFKNFDEYVNSLKRRDRGSLKRDLKKMENITIKEGKFSFKYLVYLNDFLKEKYDSKIKRYISLLLSISLFLKNELNYWEYYDKETNEFLGWSSYFIIDDIYYDFISCPKKVFICYFGINSIKYCLQNSINKVDFGPTNIKLKMRKFNAEIIEY